MAIAPSISSLDEPKLLEKKMADYRYAAYNGIDSAIRRHAVSAYHQLYYRNEEFARKAGFEPLLTRNGEVVR